MTNWKRLFVLVLVGLIIMTGAAFVSIYVGNRTLAVANDQGALIQEQQSIIEALIKHNAPPQIVY